MYSETQLYPIGQPHNSVHGRLGCSMASVKTAAYDPLFWLHHSFIDYIWAKRQKDRVLDPMTNFELNDTVLEPFGGN